MPPEVMGLVDGLLHDHVRVEAAQQLLDGTQLVLLAEPAEGYGLSLMARPAGTADAVDIVLVFVGHVIVKDHVHGEYNFTTLLVWAAGYQITIADVEGFLTVRLRGEGGFGYLWPGADCWISPWMASHFKPPMRRSPVRRSVMFLVLQKAMARS